MPVGFDPARLRDDYVETGFKGYLVQRRAVPGHQFGLRGGPRVAISSRMN